jgi:hypothetical protein
VARIEEARGTALRGRLAGEQRFRARHRESALLERLAHRREILGLVRAVEDLARALIRLQRLVVALLGLIRHPRHLQVDIERADFVAERDEIVPGSVTHLLPLALVAEFVTQERHVMDHTP